MIHQTSRGSRECLRMFVVAAGSGEILKMLFFDSSFQADLFRCWPEIDAHKTVPGANSPEDGLLACHSRGNR